MLLDEQNTQIKMADDAMSDLDLAVRSSSEHQNVATNDWVLEEKKLILRKQAQLEKVENGRSWEKGIHIICENFENCFVNLGNGRIRNWSRMFLLFFERTQGFGKTPW